MLAATILNAPLGSMLAAKILNAALVPPGPHCCANAGRTPTIHPSYQAFVLSIAHVIVLDKNMYGKLFDVQQKAYFLIQLNADSLYPFAC